METPIDVNKEIDQMLLDAMIEIRQLRHTNEILQAKVSTMELFSMVLKTQPAYSSQGMSPDVTWQIEKYLSKAKS